MTDRNDESAESLENIFANFSSSELDPFGRTSTYYSAICATPQMSRRSRSVLATDTFESANRTLSLPGLAELIRTPAIEPSPVDHVPPTAVKRAQPAADDDVDAKRKRDEEQHYKNALGISPLRPPRLPLFKKKTKEPLAASTPVNHSVEIAPPRAVKKKAARPATSPPPVQVSEVVHSVPFATPAVGTVSDLDLSNIEFDFDTRTPAVITNLVDLSSMISPHRNRDSVRQVDVQNWDIGSVDQTNQRLSKAATRVARTPTSQVPLVTPATVNTTSNSLEFDFDTRTPAVINKRIDLSSFMTPHTSRDSVAQDNMQNWSEKVIGTWMSTNAIGNVDTTNWRYQMVDDAAHDQSIRFNVADVNGNLMCSFKTPRRPSAVRSASVQQWTPFRKAPPCTPSVVKKRKESVFPSTPITTAAADQKSHDFNVPENYSNDPNVPEFWGVRSILGKKRDEYKIQWCGSWVVENQLKSSTNTAKYLKEWEKEKDKIGRIADVRGGVNTNEPYRLHCEVSTTKGATFEEFEKVLTKGDDVRKNQLMLMMRKRATTYLENWEEDELY